MSWWHKLFGSSPLQGSDIHTDMTCSADLRVQPMPSSIPPSAHEKAERIVGLVLDECKNAERSFRLRDTGKYIEELVGLGSEAIPVIVDAINNVIKYGASGDWLGAVANMCTAIGRIGGPTAFDLLAHYALGESTNPSYREIRYGAITGLAQLGDQRGRDVLARVLTGFAGFERETHEALQRLGVTDPAILTAAPPWHAGVDRRDSIAIAHAFRIELQKDSPDFAEFERVISMLDKNRQYTAWHELAASLEMLWDEPQRLRVAGQCWVQALCCDPSPVCFGWPALADRVVPTDLQAEFKRCYRTWGPPTDQASESERIAMARRLERLLGRPGEMQGTVNGTPV
jgi:hypothetical protein